MLVFRAYTQPITAINFPILYDFLLNQNAYILRVKSNSSTLSTGERFVHKQTNKHTHTHTHTQTDINWIHFCN